MTCSESQTRLRRVLVAVAPRRRPGPRAARWLLVVVYRVAGFSDWVNHRAETLIVELEDLEGREAWARSWQRRAWNRLIWSKWL